MLKKLKGIVVGNKCDKTASVLVERIKIGFGKIKYVRKKIKKIYHVHDPQNKAEIGQEVFIRYAGTPLTGKTKSHILEYE